VNDAAGRIDHDDLRDVPRKARRDDAIAACDHLGSVHCSSKLPAVSGVTRLPLADTRTRRVAQE
jgi:hypothetical protein